MGIGRKFSTPQVDIMVNQDILPQGHGLVTELDAQAREKAAVEAATLFASPLQAEIMDFHTGAKRELSKALTGEDEAKTGFMAAAISGNNMLALGTTGIGKTILLDEAYKLFTDLSEHSIKPLPPQSDLTGKEVTGGVARSTKKITDANGNDVTEITETTIDPILHPELRIIRADEVNRANPLAVGAMLEGLESGRVVTNQGIIALKGLEFAILAINPKGIDKTVFPLGQALVSRLPIGVYMGENPADIDPILDNIIDKNLSNPEEMKPVISINDLRRFRAFAEQKSISAKDKPRAKEIIKQSREALKVVGINEGLGRFGSQIVNVGSALAALGGNVTVTTGDLMQATKFGLVSRMGALESKEDPHLTFQNLLDRLSATEDEVASWHVSSNHRLH